MSASVWVSQHLHQKLRAFSRIINNSKRFLSTRFCYIPQLIFYMPGPRKESLKIRAIWADRRRIACETGGTFCSKSCQIPIRPGPVVDMLSLFLHPYKPNLLYFHDVYAMHQVFSRADLHSTLPLVHKSQQADLPVR